jgi:hypothetical protein
LLRKAAEYADAEDCAAYVARCQAAARRALDLDPGESCARVALAGLAPIFGNWAEARTQVLDVLATTPDDPVARHDLAIIEMSTGLTSVARQMIEALLAEDGFAATFHYKRMYHLWAADDVHGAEQVAGRALQLWPRHPAIWSARFWILVGTGRADLALRFVEDSDDRPPIPEPAVAYLARTAAIAAKQQAGALSDEELSRHAEQSVGVAALGPAQAVAALMGLGALGAVDAAFEVARGYYLGQGRGATPLRRNAADPSITDQHRRVTQPLFVPSARRMREDPRFLPLCDAMGLVAYWNRFGLTPDFLGGGSGAR